MKAFIVRAHAEPKSFNGALFRMAQETLRAAGHTVVTSDLHPRDPASHSARDSAFHRLVRAVAEHHPCAGPRFAGITAGAPEQLGGAVARPRDRKAD